jgi:uncharacterized protein YndB with AHSA1/START domain
MADEQPVGKTKDAGWEVGVSRTVNLPVEAVWELLVSPEVQALWLGSGELPTKAGESYETDEGTVGEVRSFHPQNRIRLTWQPPDWSHESTVQVAVSATGPDSTVLRFHQERLADADERERQRAHWAEILDEIADRFA